MPVDTDNGQSIVSTGNPLAARAALKILKSGGSAMDAAIAADAVMGVVEPMATSVGGDVLALIYQANQTVISYNGTGRAPLAIDVAAIRNLPHSKIPERHPLSVTTPGAVSGWWDLHQKYGKLSWSSILQPAIQCAQYGFPVAKTAAREWKLFDFVLHNDPLCSHLYGAGSPPEAGSIFINPDLASTLEGIAEDGPEFFYQGPIAEAAAKAVQAQGGALSKDDFDRHEGNFVDPLSIDFFGAKVYECPPNTHGTAVLDALASIERRNGDPRDPETWVHMVRATGSALERAKQTVADPSGNTVCTVVSDRWGLSITLMSSVFKRFGSGIVVPGGGFCLQNRGFGFSEPGHINGPAPGKRPYHTVIPALVTRNAQFDLGIGVVGGLMQPQGQIQILTRVLAWGNSLKKALDAPRWRLESTTSLALEEGIPESIARAVRASGYEKPHATAGELGGRSDFGGAHAIIRERDGRLVGAADPRKDGEWLEL